MIIEQILGLIATNEIDKLHSFLKGTTADRDAVTHIKNFDPNTHEVMDEQKRKNKIIYKDGDFERKEVDHHVAVARLPLAFQRKIVNIAATFLGSPEILANIDGDQEQELMNIFEKITDDNKLQYKFKQILKLTMSETHCAELWYTIPAKEGFWTNYEIETDRRLRVRILAESLGDQLYPVFDEYNDMVAFGRGYEIKNTDIFTGNTVTTIHLDLYTDERIFSFVKTAVGAWEVNQTIVEELLESGESVIVSSAAGVENPYGKIPVVYYHQDHVEWHDVQHLITRLENKTSNHADTNDYYDSPIVVASGQVMGFANKGEQGKILQADNGAKVEYLTWDNAPQSMKLEIDQLWKYIHTFTSTPDISFESMKGIGAPSGFALKMLFMDAHMKASEKEEIFGEGVQRRINLLKHMVTMLDERYLPVAEGLEIYPEFTYFLPANPSEDIDVLIKAVDGGLMSKETAIGQNPLISDAEFEIKQMEDEKPEPIIPVVVAGPQDPNSPKPPVPPVGPENV